MTGKVLMCLEKSIGAILTSAAIWLAPITASATPFTSNVPGENIPLPSAYPEAGGVAIVMIGDNGNIYYQFSDPAGAFQGFQSTGQPAAFRGNPFTINNPIPLDCGVRTCTQYFGGGIDRMYIRFSAYDGDTQINGFDEDDIDLIMNGVSVGNWSDIQTEKTNNAGTQSFGFEQGFGNNSFNTGWFSTTNQTLLNNILSSGQTTTQVFDADPNDNYWDFRRGNSLGDEDLRTVAPGYEFEKTADVTTFAAVGDPIVYTYTVTNIGSVNINNLQVTDDRIPNVTCDKTTINETTGGGTQEFATCTGTYLVTQEDFDSQSVTNIATAIGDPEFGSLGEVEDTVTVNGPATLSPSVSIAKVADMAAFSAVGDEITYTYTITNDGDATLSNIVVTDDKIPGTICTIATLAPATVFNPAPANETTCTATYEVTQDDIDAFAVDNNLLTNVATVTAQDPNGIAVGPETATETVPGPTAAPALTILKTALQSDFDAVNDLIQFEILITNTGNVTWPAAPAIQDDLVTNAGGAVTCPAGPVAPMGQITCTADYRVEQGDLDAETLENIAIADITINGVSATGTDNAVVPAIISTGLEIVKRLPAGAETTFDSTTDQITYEYVLTNTGTVRLFNPMVTDDKVTVTCPAGPIAPNGGTLICTSSAPYDVQQLDLDAGFVTNIASASAETQPGTTVDSDQTSLTVSADQMPALTLEKTADPVPPGSFTSGQTVTYTFTVENTGNVTLTDPVFINDDRIGAPFECNAGPVPPAPELGSTVTCTNTYDLTIQDVADGFVTNRATATSGATTSNEDTATVSDAGAPEIQLSKAADPAGATFSALTDTIDYVFTVTNTGTTTITPLQPITIDDPKIANVTCVQLLPILPTQSIECTGTYSGITQAEIDAGEVINTATASYMDASGVVTSPAASTTVPSAVVPAMSLTKTGPASFGAVNTPVTFTFEVTNDSAQTIATATVTDPKIPSLSCDFTDIAPFSSVTCSGDYLVTQADLDAGTIDNTATANGTAPTGELLTATANETVTADPAAQVRALSLDKTANVNSFSAVGDEIVYTFAVTNTGTMTLNDIVVVDALVGLNCTIPTLAPMTTNDTQCSASHFITQDDLDAGTFDNSATATAPGADPSTSTEETTGPTRNAAFTIEKTANDATDVQVNQVITYSHVVTNTGNVTLTNITLTDSHTSASGTVDLTFAPSNTIATLAPGDEVTVTTSYTVTQDDIDAGANLTNIVSGTATPPAGVTAPSATDTETVDVEDAAPAVSVVKTEDDGTGTFDNLPSSEIFRFEVFNDGNVTLTGLTLTDDLTGFTCDLPDIIVGGSATQCDDTTPLQTTYTITQADIDANTLLNTVDVTDGTLIATDSVTLEGPTQVVALSMVKTATSGADFAEVGDEITYDYVITNDDTLGSNITLRGPFSVVDDKTTVQCPATPVAGIPPGGMITCTATYAVTQDDLDLGSVTNTATASITQNVVPGGPATFSSAPAMETVGATQTPMIEIAKTITPDTPSTFSNTSESLSYDFTITNTGNVTIPAPITVNDDQIGNGLTCGTAALAPDDSVTCTHTWDVTQEAIDAGSITNIAAPIALFDGNPVPADTDTVTALAVQNPDLTIEKTFDLAASGSFAAGQTFSYDFKVTNTGNTTITTEPTINDTIIDAADISINDPFPAGGLIPGGEIFYTGTYVLTLADIQLGSVTNTATATSNGVTSDPSSVTTPDTANPAISVEKSADVATFSAVGDEIVYTYIVTNRSDGSPAPALANDFTITDSKFPGVVIPCDPPANGQLLVGESTECRATYLVTQDDLDADEVVNSAVAETEFAGQAVLSPFDLVEIDGTENPSLAMLKEVIAGNDPAEVGDLVTYRMTATNDGNQTLSNVQITDPRITDLTCTVGGVAAPSVVILAPTEVLVCEGDYEVTQDDVDAQELENTATVSATNPQGTPVDATDMAAHQVDPFEPLISVEKRLTSGEPGSDYSAVGEQITYAITVLNEGNITLTSIDVTDSIVAGTCTVGPLAPGESDSTCEFIYEVTQTDIDNGVIDNTATAVAQPATPGSETIEGEDTLQIVGPAQEPSFSLTKDADLTNFNATNTTITYTYIVANTGNVTLTAAPIVSDDKIPSVICDPFPVGGLLPGEFVECSAIYETNQDDLDNGGVTNIASVSSIDAPFDPSNPGSAQATETVPAIQSPGVTMEKTANNTTDVQAGETIIYSYEIENTGNVTLTNVTLDDQHTSASGTAALTILPSNVIASLAPDEIVILTAEYVITQEDIDAGNAITNTVTLTSISPDGTTPTVTDDATVTPEGEDPAIEAIKTVASNTGVEAGDSVTFEITVENTGNVTLSGIGVADTLRRQDGSLITPAPTPSLSDGDGGTLSPDEIWTYEITHTLTQEDVDAGGLSNSVTVSGTSPFSTVVTDISDTGTGGGSTPTPFAIPSDPSLEAAKIVSIENTGVDEYVTFEITITNTGNVTLGSVAVASDTLTRADGTPLTLTTAPAFSGASLGSGDGTLQVGEVATYTATYQLTQEDVDAGGIENTATATGTPPTGSPVTDVVDTPAAVVIEAEPSISMVKTLASGGPTFDAVNDVLTYNFTVTNTGNVTLTDPITIDDPLITDAGGTITCPAPPLAPMGVAVCEGSYSITQEDIDAGEVINVATATVPDAPTVEDTTTTPAQQSPAMVVVKEAEEVLSANFVVGLEVDFTYTVTNTGNTTLTEPISITDNLIPDVICADLPAGGLLPGDDLVCTGTYEVTSTDVQISSVTNLATATSGTLESPQTSETIPADGTPALTIAKTISSVTDSADVARAGGVFSEVGDKLTFEFTITNSGEVSFANEVPVTDDHIDGPIACFVPDAATNPDLTPGETVTCQATYVVTQDDLDAGFVLNSAFAQTTFGVDPPTVVTSPPDTETVNANTAPALEIVKTVDNATYAAIGDVLTYTFTATNTGNQTLTNIAVADPLIPTLDCTIATLLPDDELICTATLTITQDELDAGEVVNTASASGVTPNGGGVGGNSDPVTSTAPTGSSVLSLVKSATPDPFGGVGTFITYAFAVTNDGPFTLENVTVTDPLVPGFSCIIPVLRVGETNTTSCRMPYEVLQEDVDRGFITNKAGVFGTTPNGRTSTAESEITTDGPAPAPSLEVIKTASVPSTTLGSIITYTLVVENTGNVTLNPPVLTDTMTRIETGRTTFLTTPFVLQSGDDNTDDLLDVDESWVYTATYELTQSDINAGGVSNTVTAEATDLNGNTTSDVSDEGIDGNGNNNPTLVPVTADPVLDVTKSLVTGGSSPGDTVTFRIEAANRGNVDIDTLSVSDTLTRRDGTDISAGVSTPVRVGANAAETLLSPGSAFAWEVTYDLTQEDIDAGGISNLADVSGLGPLGDPITETSTDDDPADGNPAVDPTELNITPMPAIETVKVVTSAPPTGAGDTVTFVVTATNLGNVTLSNVVMVDTMTNADGTVLSPVTITPPPDAGVTLGSGDDIEWTVTYQLTQDDVDSGGVSNTATATGTTPTGLPVSDISDDDDNLDGNTNDDPTEIAIDQDTTLIVQKTATTPSRITGSLFETVFTITVENDGNVTHRDLSVLDDLTVFVAPATLDTVATPVVTGLATGGANGTYDGVGTIETLAAGSTLNVGDTATIEITVRFDIAAGSPSAPNTASVTSDFTAVPVTGSVSLPATTADPDVLADKTVTSAGPYTAGSIVSYAITFTNRNATPELNLTLIDILPSGMAYIEESALIDGAATPTPTRTGRRLEWSGITVPANGTVTITLSAQLLDGGGSYVNEAFALDSTGVQISNTATARVDVTPEAVFDCSDVIGKVFDDANQNGYQDPPADARAEITNQDYEGGGKFGVSPAIIAQQQSAEPGLAGVQLVTVRGDIITTDEYGRFSVPCALLPGPTGANFTLKLDDRSLPTGYRVTTENPRTLRLTSGIMTEMNFGASLANLVDIDLLAAAFVSGSAQPSAAVENGVDTLIDQIAQTPSVLRLTYYTNGESNETARARLRAVEALIRDRWRGPYRLRIETTIARVQ